MGQSAERNRQVAALMAASAPLLGTVSDRVLAARLGVAASTVCRARVVLGIPAFTAAKPGAPQGHQPPERRAAVAAALEALRPLMGVVTDAELAKRAGVHQTTVTRTRRQLGVPAARPLGAGRQGGRRPGGPVQWPPDVVAMMGQTPDRVVGALMGVSHQRVAQVRAALGIAAFNRG